MFQGNCLGDEVRWRAGGGGSRLYGDSWGTCRMTPSVGVNGMLDYEPCKTDWVAHTHTIHTHRSLSLPLSFCPYSPPFSLPWVLISDVNAEVLECRGNCHVRTLKFTGTRSEMWGCKIQLRCSLIIDSLMQAESSRTSRQDINNTEGKEKEVAELVVLFKINWIFYLSLISTIIWG